MLTIKVTIVEAQGINLPADADPGGHLHCGVTVLPHSSTAPSAESVRTKTLPAGPGAKWDEALDVEAESQDKLAFECWLVTPAGKDVLVGRVEMAVSSLVVGSSSDKWLALKAPETTKPAGLLHALIHPRPKRSGSRRAVSPSSNDKIKPGAPKGPTFEPSDLEKWLSAEELASLDEKERSRQKAILEVIETERSYMNDLDILQRIFIKPIHENNYLTKSEMNSVFSNVETLREINLELMKELDELQSKKVAIKNLGEVFAKRESMFKLYAIFCSAIVDVNQRVEQFKDKNPPFAAFLEKCFVNPECRLLPLDSFVHAPLARLLKYPLLLDAVIKYTPSDHPDREPLEKVYENLMEIVNMVNERTRQVENVQRLIKLQKTIANPDEPGNDFVDNQRFVVREGLLARIKGEGKNKKERKLNIILFNDMLVLTKPLTSRQGPSFRVIEKIPTKDLQVADSPPTVIGSLSSASSSTLERSPSNESDSGKKPATKESTHAALSGSGGLKVWRSTMRVTKSSSSAVSEPDPELRLDIHCRGGGGGGGGKPLTFVALTPEERAEWKKAVQTAIGLSTREQTFSFKTSSARTRDGESASTSASSASAATTLSVEATTKSTDLNSAEPRTAPSPGSAGPAAASAPTPSKEKKEKKEKKKEKKDKKEKKKKKSGSSRREKTKKIAKEEDKNAKNDDGGGDGPQSGGGDDGGNGDAQGKSPGAPPRKSKSEANLKRSDEDAIDASTTKPSGEAKESKESKESKAPAAEVAVAVKKEGRKSWRKSLTSILRKDDIADAFAAEEQKEKEKDKEKKTEEKATKKKTFGTWGRKKKLAAAVTDAAAAEPAAEVPSEGKTKKKG